MAFFRKMRDKLIMSKIYFGRSQSYLSMINSCMILFLTLSALKERGYIDVDLSSYFLLLSVLGFFVLLFLGYLEMKLLKGLHKEQQMYSELNPFLMDLKTKLDYLCEKKNEN